MTVGAGSGPEPPLRPRGGQGAHGGLPGRPLQGRPLSSMVVGPGPGRTLRPRHGRRQNALHVDPITAQVTAGCDPLPQILQGIPIAYRDVEGGSRPARLHAQPDQLRTRRRSPASLTSASGQTATPPSRFQVGECGKLGFGPKLKVSLKGEDEADRQPGADRGPEGAEGRRQYRQDDGDPAEERSSSTTPTSTTPAPGSSSTPTPARRARSSASRRAYTPLLDKPARGPVYFRSNGGERELPDLVADLNGQIHVTLVGYIDSVKRAEPGSGPASPTSPTPRSPSSS